MDKYGLPVKIVNLKNDLADAQDALGEDQKFAAELKKGCSTAEADYEEAMRRQPEHGHHRTNRDECRAARREQRHEEERRRHAHLHLGQVLGQQLRDPVLDVGPLSSLSQTRTESK
mgnify:CR=1 FL=1